MTIKELAERLRARTEFPLVTPTDKQNCARCAGCANRFSPQGLLRFAMMRVCLNCAQDIMTIVSEELK